MKTKGNFNRRILLVLMGSVILFSLIFIGLKSKISGLASNDQVIVSVKLEPSYPIARGSLVIMEVKIYQPVTIGERDVDIDYYLVDDKEKQKIKSETVALDTYLSIISKMEIPPNVEGSSVNLEIEVLDPKTKELLGSANQRVMLYDKWPIIIRRLATFIAISLVIIAIILLIMLLLKCRNNLTKPIIPVRSAKIKLK